MTADPDVGAAILRAEPQLFVTDLMVSLAFFESLGFSIAFTWGEPPSYGHVVRGGAHINLREVEGPVHAPGFAERERDPLGAILVVAHADTLFREFEGLGVPFHQRLRDEPWGARTFIVRDPDGNLLLFAGPAA